MSISSEQMRRAEQAEERRADAERERLMDIEDARQAAIETEVQARMKDSDYRIDVIAENPDLIAKIMFNDDTSAATKIVDFRELVYRYLEIEVQNETD